MADMPAWTLEPGQTIERKHLHEQYGGRTQGGIGPSSRSPNVLIFTDPIAGEKHGYYDGDMPDGRFHYTGEGQHGDQRMMSGNASILNHRTEGRALRVFQGARGMVTYLGEFEIDPEQPWYETDAPESGGGPVRKVIVFRLKPVNRDSATQPLTSLARLMSDAQGSDKVREIPIEQQGTERSFVDPSREPYEAERKEADLVTSFADHLRRQGLQVTRHVILPPDEKPLFTDLYVPKAGLLVEAKGSVTRENIRMALGQLADYRRFLPDATQCAILVPSRPREDLFKLITSQDIGIIWKDLDTFRFTPVTYLF